MSLEAQTTEHGAPRFFNMVAACMAHVGKKDFNEYFLNIIEDVIRADQCMIYSYTTGQPVCYMSYNARSEEGVRVLAGDYITSGYKMDPLLPRIENIAADGGFEIVTYSDLEPTMCQDYRSTYFETPGLIDNISIIAKGHGEVLMVSFYRFSENGTFSKSEDSLRDAFWKVTAQLLLLHYSHHDSTEFKSPLASLSSRERDVCEGILRGLTTEGIASDLDIAPSSVTTYRKRAYIKLGINSKTALFALCMTSE